MAHPIRAGRSSSSGLDPRIPLPLRWTIERCLAKETGRRYQSTQDLCSDLRQLRDHLGDVLTGTIGTAAASAVMPRKRHLLWWPWAAAGIAALLGAAAALLLFTGSPATLTAGQFRPLATTAAKEGFGVWSPDASGVAYQAKVDDTIQVFTRSLESAAPLQVTHCATDCTSPAWSADGGRLFVLRDRAVWSIGAAGGEMDRVASSVDWFAVSRQGDSMAGVRQELDPARVSIAISSPPGAKEQLYTGLPLNGARFNAARLAFSPDGKKLLFWLSVAGQNRLSEYWILPLPVGSGKPQQVLASLEGSFPVRGFSWMPDNRRIVVACAAFPDSWRSHLYVADIASGVATPLVIGIGLEAQPDVSRDGRRLVYSALESDADIVELPLDGSPPRDLIATNRIERNAAWSPKARQLAYVTDRSGGDEIWITTLEEGWDKPLITPRSFRDGQPLPMDAPAFSRDGQRIAFARGARIWIASVAGGTPVPLGTVGGLDLAPTWSPDGNWIAFQAQEQGLMKARVGGKEPPVLLYRQSSWTRSTPEWSPHGDFIAYATEKGTALISPDGREVRVVYNPPLVATGWSADGAILYGVAVQGEKQALVAVDIAKGTVKTISEIPSRMRVRDIRTSTLRLTLAPDGKSLATSLRTGSDIWMLEDFDPSRSFLSRLG